MREKYESLSAIVLKDLAKARGLKNVSAMKKSDLIELMLAEDARQAKEKKETSGERVRENGGRETVRESGPREGGREGAPRENAREGGEKRVLQGKMRVRAQLLMRH